MASAVIMPRQGNTVESCIVTKWHKKKGDKVAVGDILFTYETDKATFDEESAVAGTILEIFFEEDDDVPVLSNMCVIGEEGEDISEFTASVESTVQTKTEESKSEPEKVVEVSKPVETFKAAEGDIRISPRAKNRADRQGIDTAFAAPSGPGGRIIERDIEKLEKGGPAFTKAAAPTYEQGMAYQGSGIGGRVTAEDTRTKAVPNDFVEYEDAKVSNIRKVIGNAMHASLSGMAQLTLNSSFDATSIMNVRKSIKNMKDTLGLPNITLNDLVVFATAKTLLKHKDLNAHFTGDTIRRFNTVHMGIAVDTERGLMVPTLGYCDLMSLGTISNKTKELADMCKKGTINPDLLQGGTFTITNLGALGIESFTPVINPPQTAILGVCGIKTAVRGEGGNIEAYQSMGLSLTFDHRAVDGAPAARFLKDLCVSLENFDALLLGQEV
ncbi:MAG TPA: dihydrolipoamide acetyltransferase family protein [Clostridia bacterium]|nr:dihydrolipoamide acetyltransferase family protein [Clostridia bacterium]HPQ46138.1 dihydrolipoamide acetyltransferase family protein [Clostridia bacterium]